MFPSAPPWFGVIDWAKISRGDTERALLLDLERAARHVTSKAMIVITDHHDRAAWESMRDAFEALDAFRKS